MKTRALVQFVQLARSVRVVRVLRGAAMLLATCTALTAQAQQAAYPSRPVRMIIPAAPGGNPDLLARMLSQKLADAFGKPFISNPDLVRRLRDNAPLNALDAATMFGGDEKGYIDYPTLDAAA